MHRKRSLLHQATLNRSLCTLPSSSRPLSFALLDAKSNVKRQNGLGRASHNTFTTLRINRRLYYVQAAGNGHASSPYRRNSQDTNSQTQDSRLRDSFKTVGREELIQKVVEGEDKLAFKEVERRGRDRQERTAISVGEVTQEISDSRGETSNLRMKNMNGQRNTGPRMSVGGIKDRTVLLTPWRGAPTFLHGVAFVKELERRYGKIQWCGISRDDANPYEYRPSIVVIFESPTSLRKMPGFSFTPSPIDISQYQPLTKQDDLSASTDAFDMGPSTSLDPTDNPTSQAMLRRIQIESERAQSRTGKTATSEDGTISPLFMPWSEKLDEAALQKGGPGLEEIIPFLENLSVSKNDASTKREENIQESGEGAPGETISPIRKATWGEFDELINIDAVVRKWTTGQVYLPRPSPPPRPHFKQSSRINVAQAFVDFGGFSEQPVESMKNLVKNWKSEIDKAKAGVWMPYDEETLADEQTKGMQSREDEPLEQDEDWDLFPHDAWVADTYPKEGSDLLPRESYQRIGNELELEEDEVEWEGLGAHPLQFPETVRGSGGLDEPSNLASTSSSANVETSHPSQPAKVETVLDDISPSPTSTMPPPHMHPQRVQRWDTWRTDPRPFRGGVGRDDPLSPPSQSNQTSPPTHTRVKPKPWQWTKPGLGSSTNQQKSAMQSGWHSHSAASQGWEKDKRGRKMKRREDSQFEVDADAGFDADGGGSFGVQMEDERKKEEKKAKERDLKARLRAILDGTNV